MQQRNDYHGTISLAVFECRFVAHILNYYPIDQIVYGKRVGDYAATVAPAYWDASREEDRSPEQYAQDDMEFWAIDHATPLSLISC
jgi:hypothetical protein